MIKQFISQNREGVQKWNIPVEYSLSVYYNGVAGKTVKIVSSAGLQQTLKTSSGDIIFNLIGVSIPTTSLSTTFRSLTVASGTSTITINSKLLDITTLQLNGRIENTAYNTNSWQYTSQIFGYYNIGNASPDYKANFYKGAVVSTSSLSYNNFSANFGTIPMIDTYFGKLDKISINATLEIT